jgi:hypothetical protein
MASRNMLRCILHNFTLLQPFFINQSVFNISETNMATELGFKVSLYIGVFKFTIYNMG